MDILDRACVEECPVDCIYEGDRMLYIHPDECVDCGACEPVCPVEAIYYEDDLPATLKVYTGENAQSSSPSSYPAAMSRWLTRRRREARRGGGRHPIGGRAPPRR